jgi:cytochrome b561
MKDRRERLSHTTIALHWLIGLTVIGMLALGLWVEDLERGPLSTEWMGIHKSIGILVIVAATLRLLWRMANGFPVALSVMKAWERLVAHGVHWALLIATIVMPLSSIVMTLAGGRDLVLFGWTVIGAGAQNEGLAGFSKEVHEIGGTVLIVLIVLHVLAALKHHLISRDATLRRMLGRKIEG